MDIKTQSLGHPDRHHRALTASKKKKRKCCMDLETLTIDCLRSAQWCLDSCPAQEFVDCPRLMLTEPETVHPGRWLTHSEKVSGYESKTWHLSEAEFAKANVSWLILAAIQVLTIRNSTHNLSLPKRCINLWPFTDVQDARYSGFHLVFSNSSPRSTFQ